MQLSLFSQRKLALTARNTVHFLHYKIIGAHKNLKTSRILYLGSELTVLDLKSQNPFRETVPVNVRMFYTIYTLRYMYVVHCINNFYCTHSPSNLCTVCHMKNTQSSTNFFTSKISLLDVEKALLRGFSTEIIS
jgi:hypothetical protein